MNFADKWIEQGKIILSKVIQTQKDKCCMFFLIRVFSPNNQMRVQEEDEKNVLGCTRKQFERPYDVMRVACTAE